MFNKNKNNNNKSDAGKCPQLEKDTFNNVAALKLGSKQYELC